MLSSPVIFFLSKYVGFKHHFSRRYVTAVIRNGTGDPRALLKGNITVPFIDGLANFTNLSVTHNGTGYILDFKVSFPPKANFTACSKPFHVRERVLYFTLVRHPSDANETVAFGQQPRIEVRDATDGSLVTNTGWKARQWICSAHIVNEHDHKGTKLIL